MPKDLQVMALRGWGTTKPETFLSNAKYLVEWRASSRSDFILSDFNSSFKREGDAGIGGRAKRFFES